MRQIITFPFPNMGLWAVLCNSDLQAHQSVRCDVSYFSNKQHTILC